MKNAQKPNCATLTQIINELRAGRYVIPDFQREFEWSPTDILALMRSIFLDYYIGSLLLWKGKQENFDALACEPIYGYAGDDDQAVILREARDLITGYVPQSDDLDDHHIVPKSWGQKEGLGSHIDTILNRTPLTSETNRKVIRDRLPNEYLPELIANNGKDAVQKTLESHCISREAFDILLRNPFTLKDFEAFIAERDRTLKDAIEERIGDA